MLSLDRVSGARRYRALYDHDGLVADLAASCKDKQTAYTRIHSREWQAIIDADGAAILRACAANRDLIKAVEEAGTLTVRAVFASGLDKGYPIASSTLIRRAGEGAELSLGSYDFTPWVVGELDMNDFVGIKSRGKWIWKKQGA